MAAVLLLMGQAAGHEKQPSGIPDQSGWSRSSRPPYGRGPYVGIIIGHDHLGQADARVTHWPSEASMNSFLPKDFRGIGLASTRCHVQQSGKLRNCELFRQEPAGKPMQKSVMQISHQLRLDPRRGDAVWLHVVVTDGSYQPGDPCIPPVCSAVIPPPPAVSPPLPL